MNVSAIIVTRGDVDLEPIFDTLPPEWERVVYDNGVSEVRRWKSGGWLASYRGNDHETLTDLAVYGRYFPLSREGLCWGDVIYVQDDDCIVSDPQAIVRAYLDEMECEGPRDCVGTERGCCHCGREDVVVCNMPQEFRQFYTGADALVGFGACFHRDAPERSFQRWGAATFHRDGVLAGKTTFVNEGRHSPFFYRTCDIVFTGLTPTVLVDVEKFDRDFATADDRMYRQPEHVAERQRMRELVRKVRDAG